MRLNKKEFDLAVKFAREAFVDQMDLSAWLPEALSEETGKEYEDLDEDQLLEVLQSIVNFKLE